MDSFHHVQTDHLDYEEGLSSKHKLSWNGVAYMYHEKQLPFL